MKILVIYSDSSAQMRKTVETYLYAFRKYLPNITVFYHNAVLNRVPLLPFFRNVDVVVFHHSITTVWDRSSYLEKIKAFASADFYGAKKVALMQDEYKNIDLLQEMISTIQLDLVYSVAPKSEWEAIYGNEVVNSKVLRPSLTGYVDDNQIDENLIKHAEHDREIDVGYRGDWSQHHVKLGKLGLQKYELPTKAKLIASRLGLKTDISVGQKSFISGDAWFEYLATCRYVLGVASGCSVLDQIGDIEMSLRRLIRENKFDQNELYKRCVEPHEGSINMAVLSPRHFEAMVSGCGQILVRSEYNEILIPWRHYLPIEADYSNLDKILEQSKNEELRKEMVNNCVEDILLNSKYRYSTFVAGLLEEATGRKDSYQREGIEAKVLMILNRMIEKTKRWNIIFARRVKIVQLIIKLRHRELF